MCYENFNHCRKWSSPCLCPRSPRLPGSSPVSGSVSPFAISDFGLTCGICLKPITKSGT